MRSTLLMILLGIAAGAASMAIETSPKPLSELELRAVLVRSPGDGGALHHNAQSQLMKPQKTCDGKCTTNGNGICHCTTPVKACNAQACNTPENSGGPCECRY